VISYDRVLAGPMAAANYLIIIVDCILFLGSSLLMSSRMLVISEFLFFIL